MLSLNRKRERQKQNTVLLTSNKTKTERMVIGRRKLMLVGFGLFMLLGFAIYFRLWTIDYSISSDEADILRSQFDLANREAMDESAEWRLKFDEQVQRTSNCEKQLTEFKEFSVKENRDGDSNQNIQRLQEENVALLKQVETLRQELEAEKLKCH